MAKQTNETTKNQSKYDFSNTLATMKRKEFWIGLVTTCIVLLVAANFIPWNKASRLVTNKTSNMLSPLPTSQMVKDGTTPEASPSAVQKQDKQMASITKKVSTLADTAGYYSVVEGDNYYTISVKVCGTGYYFQYIQAANNSQPLHTGDLLVVNCTE